MTLLAFAFGAGALATVSPCGFAVLPAFLAYYLTDEGGADDPDDVLSRVAQGFKVGIAVSGGFALVFTVAGLVVSIGVRSLARVVPWAAVVVGIALVVLGLAMLTGRRLALDRARGFGPGPERGWRRMFVFGAGYAVASLSCTLAVLLAVVAQALATSSPVHLVGVFAAYAVGAATVLVALSVSAAVAKGAVVRGIRRVLPLMERLEAAVLVASGAYLIAYWLPGLTGRDRVRRGNGIADDVSARLTATLDSNLGVVAGVAVSLAGVGLLLAVRLTRRRLPAAPPPAAIEGCGERSSTEEHAVASRTERPGRPRGLAALPGPSPPNPPLS